MSWVDQIKEALPDYAKDTRLNLDGVINRSSLDVVEANGCALAAAMATGNGKLVTFIQSSISASLRSAVDGKCRTQQATWWKNVCDCV